MRARLTACLLLGGLIVLAAPALAQAPHLNAIWARSTAGAPITLDGVLDEPAWQKADSVVLWYGRDNGIPGSGYKEEGGKLAKDSTYAVLKFLRDGNQLYLGAVVRDSSVGGSADFNRFDGFLMSLKDHTNPLASQSGPLEYFYSWWHPELASLNVPGASPGFRGAFGSVDTIPRTPAQIAAWDAVTRVRGGLSNTDADVDSGYTVEMRFDVSAAGYDFTKAGGDIAEWSISIYDCDWYWPINLYRFSSNRAWWQDPWGNAMWYDEVRIYGNDNVTVNSGPEPNFENEFTFKNLGPAPPPVIDGDLSDPVWAHADSIHIVYAVNPTDFAVRNTYNGVMQWRAGEYQPPVLGSTAPVVDPADCMVKTFFKDDTLYFGFNVNDALVQYYPIEDRWDGIRVSIVDRGARYVDRNLASRPLTFIVGPTGQALPQEYLPFMIDTLQGARVAMKLKPGTTVDTLGNDVDAGYTAELAVDLTKLGYPHGRGDGTIWFGIDVYDGDSFTPFTDSYGTRTWYGREREYLCCPSNAYMDPTQFVVLGVGPGGNVVPATASLMGAFPNPFRSATQLRYALPRTSRVTLEVYDVQGRLVTTRPLGVQVAGVQQASFLGGDLGSGLYLYRLRLADPANGVDRGTLTGKMMVLR